MRGPAPRRGIVAECAMALAADMSFATTQPFSHAFCFRGGFLHAFAISTAERREIPAKVKVFCWLGGVLSST